MCSIHIGRTKFLLRKIFIMQDEELLKDLSIDALERIKKAVHFKIRQTLRR